VALQQAIQLVDHFRKHLGGSPRRRRARHAERGVPPAAEAHLNCDRIALDQSDVFDQQRQHASAFVKRGGLIVPREWEVLTEARHARSALLIEAHRGGLALTSVLLLKGIELTQCLIPVRLQRVGDEAMVGVAIYKPAALDLCAVAQLLERPTMLSVYLLELASELVLNG
jgi:hypothetical protein